jgi:hypothetical protein
MATLELKGYSIDDITKALGAAAIGAYVLGYLILSYHLSIFGFNPVSPFRPRVLETGICTLIFFVIPLTIGVAIAAVESRGMSHAFVMLLRILCLPILCGTMCWLPGFIGDLPKRTPFPNGHWLAKLCILLVIVVLIPTSFWALKKITRWVWHNYHKRKVVSTIIVSCFSAISVIMAIHPRNTSAQIHIFYWLLATSTITCVLVGQDIETTERAKRRQELKEAEQSAKEIADIILQIESEVTLALPEPDLQIDVRHRAYQLQSRMTKIIAEIQSDTSRRRLRRFLDTFAPLLVFGYIFVVIAAYTNWVFPFIPIRLGGGQIVTVTVYLSEGTQQSQIVSGGMLDQSDQGYFILAGDHDKGLFIPKERVNAIYFAERAPDLDKVLK